MNSIDSYIQILKQRGKTDSTLELASEVLGHYHEFVQDQAMSLESVRSYCARHIA